MSRKKILLPLTKRHTHRQALALTRIQRQFMRVVSGWDICSRLGGVPDGGGLRTRNPVLLGMEHRELQRQSSRDLGSFFLLQERNELP